MAQEDDLRALGKVMDFMRGISVIFLLINCYWFCYEAFQQWHFTLGIINKILMNFQRTTGLFSSILWTKLFCVVFLALSCLGTKGVKEEKITWPKIWTVLFSGFVFFFLNWWLLALPIGKIGAASLYIFTLSVGYICLLMGGVWMSRLLKNNLMDDVFNTENESFMQETRLMENEYSVNLPTRFYYKPQFGLRSPPFYSDYSPQRFFRPCFRPKIYCFTQVNLEKCELFHFCFSLHLKLHIDRGFCIVESISRHSCQKVDNKV